jgi:hypothetical protein
LIINYKGTNIQGSADLQTSVAEEEIIPTGIKYVNFEMLNDSACHVSINGSEYIYIRANQGIAIDFISSLKIEENSISFNWIGVMA